MKTVFRTDDLPAVDRAELWQHLMDDVLGPLRRWHAPPDELHARMVTGRIGAVRVSEITAPAGECFRSDIPNRRSDQRLHQIDVLSHGEVLVEQNGRRIHLVSGDIGVIDPARPVRYCHSDSTQITVAFPRAMLPLAHHDLAKRAPLRVPGERGTAALVSALARQLPGHLDDSHAAEALQLGNAVVDLLAVALTAHLDGETGRPRDVGHDVLLRQVYAFVDEHLADPDLSPARIAAAHHVSVRQLHNLFAAEHTTVAGWVRQRRLDRCRRDLLEPTQRARSVQAIATRWGLPNPAHFNRLFKATYGVPPGQYRCLLDPPASA
jgi:AraC-like DNA-binding protein